MRARHAKRLGVLVAAAGLAAGLAGCASAGPGASASSLSGEITVFAAASLTVPFTALAEQFESANPGTTVTLNFAGSADLVTQIIEGAPADVFASADLDNMSKLTRHDLVDGEPIEFATNVLTIAVPPSNPAGIKTFADLAEPGVRLVTCAPEVPCGRAAVAVADASGVILSSVSEESSVTDVLGKVTSGEADAGLVYITDVIAAGDAVSGIEFAESNTAVNTYPIVALTGSDAGEVAQAFIEFVTGDAGRSVLAAAGFGQQ